MPLIGAIPKDLRALVVSVVVAAAVVVVRASVPLPSAIDAIPLLFWIAITLIAAAFPVALPGGVHATITTAPVLAAVFDSTLPQPFALVWITLIGTIEPREIRRQVVWYGVLYNRSSWVLSAFAAWAVLVSLPIGRRDDPLATTLQIFAVGATFAIVNTFLGLMAASLRTHTPLLKVWSLSVRNIVLGLVSQVPLGWLMAAIAVSVGHWATALFLVPLLLARYSYSRYTETRELFLGSVSALSQAIDAKDGFTRGHADRVSRIAAAIAREMRLPEATIEQIELAGLLHDIGKIGVEDRVLMKPVRLEDDERELMRRHPIYGASILEPSAALRPLVPSVRHHHENFDGTGYPDGLKGEDIPLGSRIIIVADAYEAMTSDRIYRKAIGHDKAMEQLTKYKGIQFDPRVVRVMEQLIAKHGPSAFDVSNLPAINYETLAQLRQRLAQDASVRDAHAG